MGIMTRAQDNICRLLFDDWDVLIEIKNIGTGLFQGQNLRKMVGLPSAYLNRILWRYENGLIPDLVSFLQSPWATAICHESFQELADQSSEELALRQEDMADLMNKYIEYMNQQQEGKKTDPGDVFAMVDGLLRREIREELQVKVLKFLNVH